MKERSDTGGSDAAPGAGGGGVIGARGSIGDAAGGEDAAGRINGVVTVIVSVDGQSFNRYVFSIDHLEENRFIVGMLICHRCSLGRIDLIVLQTQDLCAVYPAQGKVFPVFNDNVPVIWADAGTVGIYG